MSNSKSGKSTKGDTTTTGMESQRIYWQQWPSASQKSTTTALSRRDLITSSAAIRISAKGARARDVTQLLCETLNLISKDDSNNNKDMDVSSSPSWDLVQDAWEQDCLVLVGTLYSLPLQYVRFEHERLDALMNATRPTLSSSSSEEANVPLASRPPTFLKTDPPFHVIKTLAADDNPVEQRHRMMHHLEKIVAESTAAFAFANGAKHSTSVSPKLQWYFVPGSNHPSSPITSYIDLDGYSTSLEEEEDADDDDDTETDENDTDDIDSQSDDDPQQEHGSMQANAADEAGLEGPSQQETTSDTILMETNPRDHGQASKVNVMASEKERIFQKERQRYLELAMCQSSLQHDCVSGYMLKQSMSDPHVWKRVHCVLTDEHLWYISRIHTRLDEQGSVKEENEDSAEHGEEKKQPPSSASPMEFYSYAKHRRLGLTRALLIQPSKDKPKAPLFRTPFAFEVIDSSGAAHRFRATNVDNYKRWVTALSSRIVQSYENSLFEHAELIVRDETQARNKRMMAVAVESLWEHCLLRESKATSHDNTRFSPLDSPTLQILRFGMEVSEYRERCRHVQAILPAKYPVLAMTDTKPELKRNGSGSGHSEEGSSSSNGAFRLDSKTQELIKGAWDEAVRLGSRATKLVVALQSPPGGSSSAAPTAKMPRCLETICQHLEYVITGNFRGALTTHSSSSSSSQQGSAKSANASKQGRGPDNTRQYPPPIDLFDQLLAELQLVAATASRKGHPPEASQQSSRNVANGSTRHVMNDGSSATLKKT